MKYYIYIYTYICIAQNDMSKIGTEIKCLIVKNHIYLFILDEVKNHIFICIVLFLDKINSSDQARNSNGLAITQ